MDCSFMETILSHFIDEHGFAVDCGRTVIYGVCASCRERKEREKETGVPEKEGERT